MALTLAGKPTLPEIIHFASLPRSLLRPDAIFQTGIYRGVADSWRRKLLFREAQSCVISGLRYAQSALVDSLLNIKETNFLLFVTPPRNPDTHRTHTLQHLPRRQIAARNHRAPALRVTVGRIPFQKGLRLRFHRLADDSLRALAHQSAQLVAQGWIPEWNRRIFSRGGASPVC